MNEPVRKPLLDDRPIDDPEREQFSVYAFQADGTYTREQSFVSLARAVTWTRYITERRFAWRLGEVARITITDGGDDIVFEWRIEGGVTFPPTKGAC